MRKCWIILMLWLSCFLTACGQSAENDLDLTNDLLTMEGSGNELTFSTDSGVYAEAFELQIFAAGNDLEILYTLDGSDPSKSETAQVYETPILVDDRSDDENIVSAVEPVLFAGSYNRVNKAGTGFECTVSVPDKEVVDKCTVVRAVTRNAYGEYGEECSATYFIGTIEEHVQGIAESCEAAGTSLAMVSITMDYDDLFDNNTGIYVKGDIFRVALNVHLAKGERLEGETARSLDANYKQKGREWEREARVSFYECTAEGMEEILAQDCGVRIQGNYSRSDVQKGFRLYARSDYGENNFDYAFFGEEHKNDMGETMDKYKTLVLRGGGNCAFTSKYNDTYWQSLVAELDCET